MIAVAVALGAALVVPAVSGIPTGRQATVAVAQQSDWRQLGSRQRGIANARNFGAPSAANTVMVVETKLTPAL
jgi:hypothetical protein